MLHFEAVQAADREPAIGVPQQGHRRLHVRVATKLDSMDPCSSVKRQGQEKGFVEPGKVRGGRLGLQPRCLPLAPLPCGAGSAVRRRLQKLAWGRGLRARSWDGTIQSERQSRGMITFCRATKGSKNQKSSKAMNDERSVCKIRSAKEGFVDLLRPQP